MSKKKKAILSFLDKHRKGASDNVRGLIAIVEIYVRFLCDPAQRKEAGDREVRLRNESMVNMLFLIGDDAEEIEQLYLMEDDYINEG